MYVQVQSHVKMAWQLEKKKNLRNAQANHLYQSILGSKAMDWNLQSVQYFDELVEQYGPVWWKKKGVEKQNSKKGFEKPEHACSMEGVLWVSDWTARPYLACPTRKIQRSSKLLQF